MSDTGQNWVRARAQCTIEGNFEAISKAVQQDIIAFNNLEVSKRKDRLFRHHLLDTEFEVYRAREVFKPGGGSYLGRHPDHENDVVRVRCSLDSIVACRKDYWRFEIIPAWNENTLMCDFLIKGEPSPIWYISHKILGNILFE